MRDKLKHKKAEAETPALIRKLKYKTDLILRFRSGFFALVKFTVAVTVKHVDHYAD